MAEKKPSVAELLASISKKHNLKLGSFSDVVTPTVGWSTGNIGIDYVTGVGGIPAGRMTELYGLPSSGKTTTALQAAAGLQKRIIADGEEEYILYLDHEHALDLEYAGDLGLNLDHPSFVLAQPNWLEQGAEIALELIATGKVRMAIFDSVAAMTPKVLLDGEFDQRTAAMNRARLMSGLCQRLVALINEQNTAVVMINHLMESVEMTGRPGMPPKATTPGGKGVKYYASLRLEYKQIKNAKTKQVNALTGATEDAVGQTLVKINCVKNKVGNPFRTVEALSRFGMGFDNFWSALQVHMAHRNITVASAGRHYFPSHLGHDHMEVASDGRQYVRGEANLLAFADLYPEWRQKVITEAGDIIDAFGAGPVDTRSGVDLDGLGEDLELDA